MLEFIIELVFKVIQYFIQKKLKQCLLSRHTGNFYIFHLVIPTAL